MKIELKNIYFSERMSEETNCFSADVYVDGKKFLEAKNNGHGGCTDYHIHPSLYKNGKYPDDFREKLEALEEHCKALPPIMYHKTSLPMNLEFKIDILFDDWLKAKEEVKAQKTIAKKMQLGIVSGTLDRYTTTTWGKLTIPELLARPDGVAVLKKKVADLKANGISILNTNLPKEIMG